MDKWHLIGSAPTKEQLEKGINDYYYSKDYTITEQGEVYSTIRGKALDGVRVIQKKGRWRFERIA
jgi:hypothetical protein